MTAPTIHIYTARAQPMTDYIDALGHRVQHDPDEVFRCGECRDWRYAKDLTIRDSYDGAMIRCADECYSGKGLIDPDSH